jgi:hypothetical protein
MTDNSRAIVPVGQHGVVASVSRQIAVTEKLLGRILDRHCTSVLPVISELIENLIYTDPQTGLMWARNGNIAGKEMNWNEAMEWVKNLNYGGYSDWHLPTKEEFESLAELARESLADWFNANGFNNVLSCYYWSSSTDANYSGGAQVVGVGNGYRGYGFKVDNYNVLPVREK